MITERKIPGTDVPDVHGAPEGGTESAYHKRWLSRVGVTTAVLAAGASVATMFSSSYLNKAMLEQIVTSDSWNYYQAKGVKLAVLENRIEMMGAVGKATIEGAADDAARVTRYHKEQDEIKASAEQHQSLAQDYQKRHSRLALASTAFQIAIAMAAVALLTRKNGFWMLSIVLGIAGMAGMAIGLFA